MCSHKVYQFRGYDCELLLQRYQPLRTHCRDPNARRRVFLVSAQRDRSIGRMDRDGEPEEDWDEDGVFRAYLAVVTTAAEKGPAPQGPRNSNARRKERLLVKSQWVALTPPSACSRAVPCVNSMVREGKRPHKAKANQTELILTRRIRTNAL